MLTRIYRRDPLGFTLVCIAAYVLAMGLGNGLSERLGAAYSGNALLAALFIAALLMMALLNEIRVSRQLTAKS